MEDKIKRLLSEKLNQCLLDRIAAAGAKEGGPDILDAYNLRHFSELHNHLTSECRLTDDEMIALLQFVDPLDVAMQCWKERDPEKGFPICYLLHRIDAYERFPLVDPAGCATKKEKQIQMLKDRLDQNMSDYQTELIAMDKTELIAQSAKITAMREAHAYMKKYFVYELADLDVLLGMDRPLEFVADQWLSAFDDLLDMDFQLKDAIANVERENAAQQEKERSVLAEEKPSIRRQLQEKMQIAGQRPSPEVKEKGSEVR